MANIKQIKQRITSVQNIKKITSTMEKIATSRIYKYKNNLNNLLKLVDKFKTFELSVTHNLNKKKQMEMLKHPLLNTTKKTNLKQFVLVTSNQGLCGSHNNHVIQLAQNKHKELQKNAVFVCHGIKGSEALKYLNIPFSIYKNHETTNETTENLFKNLMQQYKQKKFNEISIMYMSFQSSGSQTPTITKLFPMENPFEQKIQKKHMDSNYFLDLFLCEPSPEEIFSDMLEWKAEKTLTCCFYESLLSEEISRQRSMKEAGDSANDMLSSLRLQYNRTRQNKITLELIDIIGTVTSLKKK